LGASIWKLGRTKAFGGHGEKGGLLKTPPEGLKAAGREMGYGQSA